MKKTINELVKEQFLKISDLKAILEKEKQYLTNKDFINLSKILSKKYYLLEDIKKLEDIISMQSEKEPIPKDEKNEIIKQLDECQKLNESNGLLIKRSNDSIERLKEKLKESQKGKDLSYDEKGKSVKFDLEDDL